jgi:hypothetical protein
VVGCGSPSVFTNPNIYCITDGTLPQKKAKQREGDERLATLARDQSEKFRSLSPQKRQVQGGLGPCWASSQGYLSTSCYSYNATSPYPGPARAF